MAIVFISPKRRQRIFFRGILAFLILLLFIISLIIFPSQFKNETQDIPTKVVFDTPGVVINFESIDSDQVKNLEPFLGVQIEFNYIAQDKDDKQVVGKISATTKDDAKILLEGMGFKVSSLQESNIGRNEPFIPYYQTTAKTSLKK